MKSRLFSLLTVVWFVPTIWASESLTTNVYAMVQSVFAAEAATSGETPTNIYYGAVGGGMAQECMNEAFRSFCTFVSNHCDAIASDWNSYETNDMVRFTTLSAIGFSGFHNLTNVADKVLSLYEANTNSVCWSTINMLCTPDDPAEATSYLGLHYEDPGVSNLVLRFRQAGVSASNDAFVQYCDSCLAGEEKAKYQDMKSSGALE